MGGVLRADPLGVETFTGLRTKQFERLLKVVWERGGGGPRIGRPWCLPLQERVLMVAVCYRTNLTMRQLAPLFGVSPTTVCRVVRRLRPLLALEPTPRPVDAADRLWIVDGTLVPVRDRKAGAWSRSYRFSANVQVIIDADTRLVVAGRACDRPAEELQDPSRLQATRRRPPPRGPSRRAHAQPRPLLSLSIPVGG